MVKDGQNPMANPFVVLREEFDDWAILFDPDTGHGFGLNPTGVYLWKCLDGEHPSDEMLKALCRDALCVPLEAGEHVLAFVAELIRQGLAGYGGAHAHDDRRRRTAWPAGAPGIVSAAVKFTYEHPQLVNLSGERATGSGSCCQSGSSNANCSPGACADIGYCFSGTTTGNYCTIGDQTSFYCTDGNVATGSNCECGVSGNRKECGGGSSGSCTY